MSGSRNQEPGISPNALGLTAPLFLTPGSCLLEPVFRRPGGHGEGPNTRSHPELGRENPQRRWYCVLRRGRVGRRQVLRRQLQEPGARNQEQHSLSFLSGILGFCILAFCLNAGWSSPVARQAHNLKVAGSNPAPATNTLNTAAPPHRRPPDTPGGLSALCFAAVKLVMPLRHPRDAEREGLDVADHGERAYNY